MEETKCYYEKGKKYQLTRDMVLKTEVKGYHVKTDYAELFEDGTLHIFRKWAWDGASGPTINDKTTMRGTGGHDVFYKFLRHELLPPETKPLIDLTLQKYLKKDGSRAERAWLWFAGLTIWGDKAADPNNKNKEYVAP